MKFKTQGQLAGSPQFKIHATSGPIGFRAGAKGSVQLDVGALDGHVSEIPIRLRIPFLRSGGGVRNIGSIGAFGVRVEPFAVAAEGFGVQLDGTLGTEGMRCDLDGSVACRMEMELAGTLPGRIARASIEMADGDDMEAAED